LSRGDRSREEGQRTPEQRERDREERERRRALRSGVAPVPDSATPPSAPADVFPAPGEPLHEHPDTEEPEPFAAPAGTPEPRGAGAEPLEEHTPAPVEPQAVAPEPVEPQLVEPAAGDELPPPVPPPPVVIGRSATASAVAHASHGRSRRSPVARLAALVAIAAALAAAGVLVAKALQGEHQGKAPVAGVAIRVLIPEGKTRVQIAQIAAKAGLKGSYRSASERSSLLDPAHYGAPRGTPDLEGFLFPATYDMNPGDPASLLVRKQLVAFRENFASSEIARARNLHVSPYQLLIVASMVEREAQVPGDRAKIAAVIYNRLRAGMPLGIDASIYYAVELEKGIATYTHELTETDLHIDSPYNTRTHTGLPPTPISNPGVASIRAAAHPAHASYLYYVAGADGCGEQVFSTTQAAFEVNAAAYQAAVKKNGGHPPTCKHH
jgi:uncharacterized YceG family protein